MFEIIGIGHVQMPEKAKWPVRLTGNRTCPDSANNEIACLVCWNVDKSGFLKK